MKTTLMLIKDCLFLKLLTERKKFLSLLYDLCWCLVFVPSLFKYYRPILNNLIQFAPLEPNEPIKMILFAPQISASYTRFAIATTKRIYIYILMLTKASNSEKGRTVSEPAKLISEINDELHFNILSIQWNSGGQVLACLLADGEVRIYKRKRKVIN